MLRGFTLGFVWLAATAAAQAPAGRRCGAPVLTPEQKLQVEAITRQRMSALGVSAQRVPGSVNVPVWFHIVNRGTGLADGDLPTSMLDEQIAVLNSSYDGVTGGANTPFRFYRAGVKRRTDATLFTNCQSDSYRNALFAGRVGGAETLNIYTCQPSSYFGWAFYPWWYSSAPSTDGVVVHFGTLPGSTWEPFNRGDTAVHEAGHWLGLYHTFEGGCSSTNDQVSDTPAEAQAHYGCPANLDSCPSLTGLDPIRNFMSYFDDDCIWEFTPGQSSRMDTQHGAYRFGGTSTPRPTPSPTPTPASGSTSIEGESGTRTGATRTASCAACSGGTKVGWVGSAAANGVTLAVNAAAAGSRTMRIDGLVSGTRVFLVTVNGAAPFSVSLSGSSFSTVTSVSTTVTLRAGGNTIRFHNTAAAPDLDRIVLGGAVPSPTPTPVTPPRATPTPTATPSSGLIEITPAGVSASTSDTNVAAGAVDNNLATRWSGSGDGAWLQLDLGAARAVSRVTVAAYRGNERRNRFDIQAWTAAGTWSNVLTGVETNGTTTLEQAFDFAEVNTQWLRYVGHGSTAGTWNSVTEMSVYGR